MYAQQNAIDPSLAALLQTAQMVTQDQTPTVAAQVAQAAQQKMQPQGIMQGMQGAKQDYAAAQPSMMRNMQQQQVQQMMQEAMRPKPAGIEGIPAQNMQGMQRMAGGGVVGYASRGYVDPQFPEAYETSEADLNIEQMREAARRKQEEDERRRKLEFLESTGAPQATQYREPVPVRPSVPVAPIPEGSDRRQAIPEGGIVSPGMAQATPAPRPVARTPALAPQTAVPATGVAALAAQPKMDLSRYEKAGAEDRGAMEKIIREQEANAAAKAAYMAGRPKFEQEGIAALTKANQAREELLAKERADDPYRRQQALLDQIGRRNLSAYSQEEARQRQRDLSAAEAQRLYEQATIKQREAEFLQGAGRFEEAKKALDDKEKILSAMQTRLNQARQTEAGIAERQFTGEVQMYEGAQGRANAMEVERMRRVTANQPGETERIFNRFNELKAKDPAAAEKYLQDIERIKGLGKGITERQDVTELKALITSLRDQADPMKNFDKPSREQASSMLKQAQDKLAQMSGLGGASTAPAQLPPAALSQLKAGVVTTFANGQQWTLENGQPKQVK